MSGEISCRALRPLFRYLRERGLDLQELIEGFHGKDRDLFSPDEWLSQEEFCDLLDRAAALSGDDEIAAYAGEAAGQPCPFGPLSSRDMVGLGPEEFFREVGRVLGLLQREGEVRVLTCQPGSVVIECVPPPGGWRSRHLCAYTRHFLGAVPRLWQLQEIQVRELRCAVPLGMVRLPNGNRCVLGPEGRLWEVCEQDGAVMRKLLGQLQPNGTIQIDGTVYGSDRCTYEIRWAVPRQQRSRLLAFLEERLGRSAREEIRRQEQTIQSLRHQIEHMKQSMEARILERVHELREKARQMALVEQAGRRFASLTDPEMLFREAVRTLREDFSYPTAALYLLEGGHWTLRALATLDETVVRFAAPIPAQTNLFQESSQPILGSDLVRDGHPLGLPRLGRGCSSLSAPLIVSGQLSGLLEVQNPLPDTLGEDDASVLHMVAIQVSGALERSCLYREERRARQRADAMAVLARVLTTSLELDQLFTLALDQMRRVLRYDAAAILLLEDGRLQCRVAEGFPASAWPKLVELFEAGKGAPFARMLGEGIPVLASPPHGLATFPGTEAFQSWLAVPLSARGTLVGAILLACQAHAAYGTEELRLASDMAGQVATAIDNARLYGRVRQERAQLEAVIEGTADGVIILDEHHQVLRLNRSAGQILGLMPEAAMGRPLAECVTVPALRDLLQSEHDGGRAEIPLADGRTYYATLTPIPGVGSVITMQDITYLKELDRMKSEFVATVSHDLRTPLQAIHGYADMLEIAGPLSEDQRRFVQGILQTAERMTSLVEQLLDLARIEAGVGMEMAPCQLAAVIAEAVDQQYQAIHSKPVAVYCEVPDDLPLVWGNGTRLGQVVANLLDNAIKYTPPHREVWLRVRVEGDRLRMEVEDSGSGIPPADLPHIFEKFYCARAGGPPGTGLGLAIARSIVQAHKGEISADNREGKGAIFSVVLPIWTGEMPEDP
ncbi:MAG: ATP-binding protein [Chloroflexia bacterium]